MTEEWAERCAWREPGGLAAASAVAGFLDSIGIAVETGPVPADSVLPGMMVRGGRLRVDPQVPAFPGDLLHEAGHMAVCDPALREGIDDVGQDPGDEMAAIAWSVAAAHACGIPLSTLFHPEGYRAGGEALQTAFGDGGGVGVPMLAWYGMTRDPNGVAEPELEPFPIMARWLR